jgi:hypothetical protein
VDGRNGNGVDLNPGKVSLSSEIPLSDLFRVQSDCDVDRCCVYVWNEWCIFEDALLENKS